MKHDFFDADPAHEAFAKEMHDLRPDILVVAGDCAEGWLGDGNWDMFFQTYRNPHGASLCVPGNHDLWMAS
jgi:metallophosphoesterase superfamily enzyme